MKNGSEFNNDTVVMNKSTPQFYCNEMYMFRSLIHDEDISNDGFQNLVVDEEELSLNDAMSHDGFANNMCQSKIHDPYNQQFDNMNVTVVIEMSGELFACGVSIIDISQLNDNKDSWHIVPSKTIDIVVDSVFEYRVCLCIPQIIIHYSQSKYDCNDLNIMIEMNNETFQVQINCKHECIFSEVQPFSNVNIINNIGDGRNLPILQFSLMQTPLPILWPSLDE